jgi:hypothetical protein
VTANIASSSAVDEEYAQQMRINAPVWTHWEGQQIESFPLLVSELAILHQLRFETRDYFRIADYRGVLP